MRGSISTAATRDAGEARRRAVRFPVPGPTSRTASPGPIAARRAMASRTRGLVSRCCPRGLWRRNRPSHFSDAASGEEEVLVDEA